MLTAEQRAIAELSGGSDKTSTSVANLVGVSFENASAIRGDLEKLFGEEV